MPRCQNRLGAHAAGDSGRSRHFHNVRIFPRRPTEVPRCALPACSPPPPPHPPDEIFGLVSAAGAGGDGAVRGVSARSVRATMSISTDGGGGCSVPRAAHGGQAILPAVPASHHRVFGGAEPGLRQLHVSRPTRQSFLPYHLSLWQVPAWCILALPAVDACQSSCALVIATS